MKLPNIYRKILIKAIESGANKVTREAESFYDDPAKHVSESLKEILPTQEEAKEMLFALQNGKSIYDTPGGQKIKNIATGLIFAGPGSKTADLFKLSLARKMESEGANADEILKNTGWFKGMEGKWKYEIPDNPSRFSMGPMTGNKTVSATEILDHPELYKAYPFLRNTKIESMPAEAPSGAVGAYLGPSFPSGGLVSLGTKARRDTALHEMQHAVQEFEGFALGGGPANMAESLNKQALELSKQAKILIEQGDKDTAVKIVTDAKILRDLAKLAEKDPEKAYKALAGEVEARNVQRRMMLEDRVNNLPWKTQDIPEDQAIIRTR